MKEGVRIVMEETGCDEGQAELALHQVSNDIEKAVKTISTLLRYIVVLKCKFFSTQKGYYGLFFLILNMKEKNIIRQAVTISYNPAVYEEDIQQNWCLFERRLYRLRLKEGSNQELSHQIEQDINIRLRDGQYYHFYQSIRNEENEQLLTIFRNILIDLLHINDGIVLKMQKEELNLMQFKELKNDVTLFDKRTSLTWLGSDNSPGVVFLDIDIMLENESKSFGHVYPVEKLKRNDLIYAGLHDIRDVANYIWRLLGGIRLQGLIPLSTIVENIRFEEGKWKIFTKFSPGIMGKVEVPSRTKVRILKPTSRKNVVNRVFRFLLIVTFIILCMYFYYLIVNLFLD